MARGMRIGGFLTCLAAFLLKAPAPAAEDAHVRKAIDRGVAVLKDMVEGHGKQRGAGQLGDDSYGSGRAALIGLTLLECGVRTDDPVIKKLAARLRKDGIEQAQTYSLALTIMFLDRVGDPGDERLLQSMGVRLLGGQNDSGGWTYGCKAVSRDEADRLGLVSPGSPGETPPKSEESMWKPPPPLPKELQDEANRIEKEWKAKAKQPVLMPAMSDNSNTQFAILGLWVAGRHGVPIEKGMSRVEARFRHSQHADGGWGYVANFEPGRRGGSTAAMTCAGLLGLAMSHGAANQAVLRTNPKAQKLPRDPALDPAVKAALLVLGTAVGQPMDPRRGRIAGIRKGYYFLWSLERVAVAYNLATIGNKDWYAWGSQLLLASQDEGGSWDGEHGPAVDTCLALLFLRRANLAKDLTASLRGVVKDPGTKLTAGGVGGEELLARGLVNGIVRTDEPAKTESKAEELCQELLKAPADQQETLIGKLKDGKGVDFTDALAAAIPQLSGSIRTKARDALAERLARMKASTLREKLREEDAEVRRAAAVACYMREERSLVPDLIGLLEDSESTVARAAHAALKELTKQDFGPAAGAPTEERIKAVAAWKTWWQQQAK